MDPVRVRYIRDQVEQLPKGNVSYKTINGRTYPYLQWTENGKQRSRVVKNDELQELLEKISLRKSLEAVLREASDSLEAVDVTKEDFYFSHVKYGQELLDFVETARPYKKRECFADLRNYVYGDSSDRVFILYGLRRTGKTTMIRQVIAEMPEKMLQQTAFIQVTQETDLAKINLDLRQLKKQGYRYVFIDEATMMKDFIEGAALFSDIFASSGMKVILSGTDSLGFLFSQSQELYDRCFMAHTTFIPYREFERVLGIKGVDEYIRYGGTMSLGGVDYNSSRMTFATEKSASDYVDTAIARNIQHSLKNYQYSGRFSNLSDLYSANELTSAINRIVEDQNHAFTLKVLTQTFKSHDLGRSANNLLRDRDKPNTILQMVDRKEIAERLREILEIKNKPEQTVAISEAHRNEIKEYLDLLDVTVDIDTVQFAKESIVPGTRTVITQPGLRYAQAEALIKTLMQDNVFQAFTLAERNFVMDRVLSEIKGRMLEEIILLETKKDLPECEVFFVTFAEGGEFDMVVFDPNAGNCSIYEVKHSDKVAEDQYQHINNEDKCKRTEHRYGPIIGKHVIYLGETKDINGIHYLNAEEYLNSLGYTKERTEIPNNKTSSLRSLMDGASARVPACPGDKTKENNEKER